jgi:hypothetical protein
MLGSLSQLRSLGVTATAYDLWPSLLEPIPVFFRDAAPPSMAVEALLQQVGAVTATNTLRVGRVGVSGARWDEMR